jgi:apolipoprotein N-acyltransferase
MHQHFTALLARFSHAVVLSWGWRRAAIAFIAGAVTVLSLAPVNAWPVLFATIPVAVWLVDGASAGRLGGMTTAAVAGWWFGFGYFVAGLYWMALRSWSTRRPSRG